MKSKLKIKFKFSWSRALLYIFMIALVAFTSMPLIYLVSTAFKSLDEMFIFPPRFFPHHPTLRNFSELLVAMDSSSVPFTRYFFNSVFVTAVSVAGSVFCCSAAAYSLTKMKLPGKAMIFQIIVAALMFAPPTMQLINYLIINKLHLINNYLALILPKIATPYYLFLLKQTFEGIPDEILEAARMDGCSPMRIYFKMILPLSKPALATVVVFAFVANWNDFYSALLYINKDALKTLPLALQMLQGGVGQVARAGAFNAAALLTTAPTIILFLIMQSKVVKTMAHTGIK